MTEILALLAALGAVGIASTTALPVAVRDDYVRRLNRAANRALDWILDVLGKAGLFEVR
jgi:hypothetical protein